VVRPAKLTLALLSALVVVGHILGLEWISRQADQISGLTLMTPPLYTRMRQPAAPPAVVPVAKATVAKPKARTAPRPKPPASSAEEVRRKKEAEEQARREAEERARSYRAERERERAEAQALAEAQERARQEQLAQAAAAASAASAPASPASAAASDTAALDRWPVDTRLTYQLTGHFRGPLFGDARVQWQRQGDKYQVRLDAKIQVFGTQVLTSQGEVTPDGLIPRAYEELRPGKRRTAQIGDEACRTRPASSSS
jgi:hypothetical protein